MQKIVRMVVILFSTVLYFVSLSNVSVASPLIFHRPEAPEELLKKKN